MLSEQYARWGGAILESVVDAVIVIDESGVILDCNSAAHTMFGYPREELVGQNVSLIASHDHAAQHDRYLSDYLRTGEQRIMGRSRRLRARRRDGTVIPISLGISEAQLDGRRVFTGVLRDATDDVQREEALRRSNDELRAQMAVNRVLQSARSSSEVIEGTLDLLADQPELGTRAGGGVFLIEPTPDGSPELRLAMTTGEVDLDDGPDRHLCDRAAETGEVLVVPRCQQEHGHYVLPLQADGEVLGVLLLYTPPDPTGDPRRVLLLQTLGGQIGMRLAHTRTEEALRRSRDELRRLALHDGLTDLLNRRAVLEKLRQERERAERSGKPLNLIMLDIDHFKRVNDLHGHLTGDAVLREVARRIRASVRPYDLVGRYGGEEFLVIVPDCDPAGAALVAERLRLSLSTEPIETASTPLRITVSMGLVSGSSTASDEELVGKADEALYQAKRDGRNRVVCVTD